MGAWASSKEIAIEGASITIGTAPAVKACGDVEWSGLLGAERWLPSGAVSLQHSSALDEGRHFPLTQHAAALRVNAPAKQSKGRIRANTAKSVIAM